MALATYANLKAAVADWLTRSDLTAFIPDFIALAESDFWSRLRLLPMETTEDLTISGEFAAVPTGWLETVRVYLDGDPRRALEYVSPFQAAERFAFPADGARVAAYTMEGGNFRFLPAASAGGTAKLLYYKRPDALSADGDTNFLLASYPGIYLYGALLQATAFIQDDERVPLWTAAYNAQVEACIAADRRARVSGAPLRARAGIVI